jgi:spore germination cell wall hydrolase CwlJ-like protein
MKMERMIAVGGLALLALNATVLYKQMSNDNEVIEIKTQIRDVKTTQQQIKRDVEQVQKVVLYKSKDKIAMSAKDLDCLAKNIYHEAGIEDRAGKVAVAQVTVNRLKEQRWGDSICKVVYAKSQFSWTLDKTKRTVQPKGELWQQSLAVAREFQAGTRVKGLEDSTHYHADYIRDPKWASAKQIVKQIGQHIFYKG